MESVLFLMEIGVVIPGGGDFIAQRWETTYGLAIGTLAVTVKDETFQASSARCEKHVRIFIFYYSRRQNELYLFRYELQM
jgi:hypothetical protein